MESPYPSDNETISKDAAKESIERRDKRPAPYDHDENWDIGNPDQGVKNIRRKRKID